MRLDEIMHTGNPATQEAEVGGSKSEAIPGIVNMRPYVKTN
jgi:hypothetical protein